MMLHSKALSQLRFFDVATPLLLAGMPLLLGVYLGWNRVLFFICCEWENQNSPHLCIFKMFRMKRGTQKCPQNGGRNFDTPPPLPHPHPCPRRGGWCLELNSRGPHATMTTSTGKTWGTSHELNPVCRPRLCPNMFLHALALRPLALSDWPI